MRFSSILHNITQSAVHKGVAFEQRSIKVLEEHLSMTLRRVGGKSDGGVDLIGWWWLPQATPPITAPAAAWNTEGRKRIRVIGQCKAEKKKASPKYVRELEGVLYRYMGHFSNAESPSPTSQHHHHSVVALLISESPFTKATLLRAHSSSLPFLLLHLPRHEPCLPSAQAQDRDQINQNREPADHGTLGKMFWNTALAGAEGLLGRDVELRWERGRGSGGVPSLWIRGERVESWTPGRESDEDWGHLRE
jgi:hypothetical protein